MIIDRQDIDQLNCTISVVIEKTDFQDQFKEELKKARGKAHLKGFRKGKVPMSSVIKMYGQGILADLVNDKLQKGLFGYISDEKVKVLGEPIPSEDHPMVDINAREIEDYKFVFDLGLIPDFELKGVTKSDNYDDYQVEVTDKEIEDELMNMRKRAGETINPEKNIEEKDILLLKAKELENGAVKEKGWETGFNIMLSDIADEDLRKDLLGKDLGHKIEFDIFKIEKNASEDHVRKYFLNIGEDESEVEVGNMFEAVVEKIARQSASEMNEEFFEKSFPKMNIKTEAEAKTKISELFAGRYKNFQNQLNYKLIVKKLVESNDFPLPEEFLKKWLVASDPKLTTELVEKDFEVYKKEIKWSIIRNAIADKFEIMPDDKALLEWQGKKIASYFASQGMPSEGMDMEAFAKQSLSDPNTARKQYGEMVTELTFEKIESETTSNPIKIAAEDLFKKLNEEK